jgi:hydroxypyruvate isomerase
MVSLNTGVGDPEAGELGLAAVPGRASDARALIDQAVEYAAEINCRWISVVAGRTGRTEDAEITYRENLTYAAVRAGDAGLGVLIEPLNTTMADDYHLVRLSDGAETIRAIGAPNLRLMADTFHVMMMERELGPVADVIDLVGHIQISGWSDRGEPDRSPDQIIDFDTWLPDTVERGYEGPFGAEYKPRGPIDHGLSWLEPWHTAR